MIMPVSIISTLYIIIINFIDLGFICGLAADWHAHQFCTIAA